MANESKKQIKALIVEDDQDQVMLYSTKFTIEGVTPVSAGNERDAMWFLNTGGIDIVLLDILLQTENGLDILKSIKQNEKTRHIPVVMFTNYAKKEVLDQAKELGAVDVIIKSEVTPKQVSDRIKEIVSGAKFSKKEE